MQQYILALDQGTTSSRAIVFGRDGRAVAVGPAGVSADPPRCRASSSTIPRRSGRRNSHVAREALARAALSAADVAAIGVTNQRETTILWDRDTRPAGRQRRSSGRAASAPPSASGSRPTDWKRRFARKTGLRGRRLFLRHQDQASARHDRPACAAGAERGEMLFGTVDTLADLAAHRRPAARHRLQQRQPHAAVQHPHARLGRRAAAAARHSPGDAAGGPPVERGLRRRRRPPSGSAGRFRSPAMRAISRRPRFGQACFEPGSAKNTYGTGCFLLLNTGRAAGRVAEQPADHHRLGARRPGDLLPGRLGVHRRRGRPVAPRRPGTDRARRPKSKRWPAACPTPAACISCRPSSGWGRPYWDPYARGAILGITRGTTAAHIWPGRPWNRWPIRRRDVLDAMQQRRRVELAASEGRRRRGGQRPADAVSGRHVGHARAAAGGGRNDGPGRGLSGRAGRRLLGRSGRRRQQLGARPAVRSGHRPRPPPASSTTAGSGPSSGPCDWEETT